MVVEIDRGSGFCFGVQNAVEIAEKALSRGEKVFSLGPIVHNDKEVERLSSIGLITIDKDQFMNLHDCKVLIRAHGEPPATYQIAEKNNITIIEATCPIVKKLQSRITKSWLNAIENNGQVVIYGKPGHAEVPLPNPGHEDEAPASSFQKPQSPTCFQDNSQSAG